MKFFRLSSMCFLFAVIGWQSTSAQGAKLLGLKFDDEVTFDGQKLLLNGMGVRKADVALGLRVDVYVAALYLDKPSKDAKAIIDSKSPKLVRIGYARSVGKEKSRETWTANFEKICKEATSFCFKEREIFMSQFIPALEDIEEDQFQEFWISEKGLRFKNHKKEKLNLQNTELGRFLLHVWLLNPPNPEISEGLLKGSALPSS
jgi:hypothetical protein